MNATPPPFPPPPPGYGAGGAMPQPTGGASGKAVASLVLGIVGLLCCPIVCSTVAIFLGRAAEKEIAGNPALGGADLAKAGFILGIVGLILGIVLVLLSVGQVLFLDTLLG